MAHPRPPLPRRSVTVPVLATAEAAHARRAQYARATRSASVDDALPAHTARSRCDRFVLEVVRRPRLEQSESLMRLRRVATPWRHARSTSVALGVAARRALRQ